MSNPIYLVNSDSKKVDTLFDSSGVAHYKLGIGDANGGYTGHLSWEGAATHIPGAAVGASDGITVVAGVESGGSTAVPLFVDTAGRPLIIGAGASGAALVGNPVRVAGSDGTDTRDLVTDTGGHLKVTAASGSMTDKSGTVATGGASQQLAAVNTARRYLFIQNLDPAEDLWFNYTTDAVTSQPSIKLGPGQAYESPAHFVSTEKITVIAATSSHPFAAKEA